MNMRNISTELIASNIQTNGSFAAFQQYFLFTLAKYPIEKNINAYFISLVWHIFHILFIDRYGSPGICFISFGVE